MFSKSFRSNDIWLWAIFFFVLTLAVNYLLFFAYQHTVPGDAIWVQISNYCGTDTFKEVTTSLMIPLILAVMGGFSKSAALLMKGFSAHKQQGLKKGCPALNKRQKHGTKFTIYPPRSVISKKALTMKYASLIS